MTEYLRSHPDTRALHRSKEHYVLTSVLDSLMGFDGKALGLIRWYRNNPEVDIEINVGKPGIGKTTASEQLAEALTRRAIPVAEEAVIIGQDEAYYRKIQDFGGVPPLLWTPEQCDEFSDNIENEIIAKREAMDRLPCRRILIVDINGLASAQNFGRSTVINLIKKYQKRVAVVAFAADYRVPQIISAGVRDRSMQVPPEELEDALKVTPFRIHVAWIGNQLQELTPEERGVVLQFKLSKTANKYIIDQINKQVNYVIAQIDQKIREQSTAETGIESGFDDSVKEYERILKKRIESFQKVTEIKPESAEVMSMAKELVFLDIQMSNLRQYGLSPNRAMLALNWRLKGTVSMIVRDEDIERAQEALQEYRRLKHGKN